VRQNLNHKIQIVAGLVGAFYTRNLIKKGISHNGLITSVKCPDNWLQTFEIIPILEQQSEQKDRGIGSSLGCDP